MATLATSEPDTTSANAITRVEVTETGDFIALRQNLLFEETYSDDDPGDRNPWPRKVWAPGGAEVICPPFAGY